MNEFFVEYYGIVGVVLHIVGYFIYFRFYFDEGEKRGFLVYTALLLAVTVTGKVMYAVGYPLEEAIYNNPILQSITALLFMAFLFWPLVLTLLAGRSRLEQIYRNQIRS